MRATVILLVLMTVGTVMIPGGHSSPLDSAKPIAAIAFVQQGGAIVSWVPGGQTPDHYVIYGMTNDTLHWIETVPAEATSEQVEALFPRYAVAAVTDGIESTATIAATITVDCVKIELTPPPPAVGVGDCTDNLRASVGIRTGRHNIP